MLQDTSSVARINVIVCDCLVGSQVREIFQSLEPSKKLIQAFDTDATSLKCQRCDIEMLWW